MLYFPPALPGSDTGERLTPTPLPRCKHIDSILGPLRGQKRALRGFFCDVRPGGAAPGGQSLGQVGRGLPSNPELDSCGGWPGGIDVSIVDLEKGK